MGHEGHESHEQHTFTSPYPCGVAGLVKKRAVPGCARTPLFSTTYADEAKIFPTHLSASLIHSHADRALCTMLCPTASKADLDAVMRLDQPRETGRGLGLAGLALERLQNSDEKTSATQLVLQHLKGAC